MDIALVCVVGSPIAAELTSLYLFDEGATAVGESVEGEQIVLTAGFETLADAERAAARVTGVAQTRIEQATPTWSITQRAHLEPTVAGRFRIRGPWHPRFEPDDALIDLVIDPGSAFGHGGHPSTSLVLTMLPDVISRRDVVVDVGAGSGVLSIAAARLGASVVAVERDPAAVAVARQNVRRNNVGDRVIVVEADAADHDYSGTTCAIANVTIDVQRTIATSVGRVPTLMLSGLLLAQIDEAARLYRSHRVARTTLEGEWASMWLERSEDSGI